MNYILKNLTDSNRNDNPIEGDFVEYTYENGNIIKNYYHETVDISEEEIEIEFAKNWRNSELNKTDFIVPLTDFPNHAAWITYRQTLRDWTTTEDFPNTKPTAPAEL